MLHTTACLALMLSAASPEPAPQPLPPLLSWKITGVSSFRNGYSLVHREAVVPRGHALVDVLGTGAATVGTLWFNTTNGLKIKRIRTAVRLRVGDSSAYDLLSLLHANKDKELVFEMATPSRPSERAAGRFIGRIEDRIIIQIGQKQKLYPASSIRTIEAAQGFSLTTPSQSSSKHIEIKLEGGQGGKLFCTALQMGFSWSPSYSIELLGPSRFRIIAQAALQNTVAPFNSVKTDLITGFPHLAYLNQSDPLSRVADAQSALGRGLQSFSYDPNDNSIVVQGTEDRNARSGGGPGAFGAGGGGVGFVPNSLTEMEQPKPNENLANSFSRLAQGLPTGDLFAYRLESLDLPDGELSQELLFQAEGDYEDVYTVFLAPPPSPVNSATPSVPEVWHSLAFANPAACPLTPAPALVKQSGQVLAHNELAYTAIKGRAVMRLGLDPEIKAKVTSQETERRRVELEVEGRTSIVTTVTEVTLVGEINLTNTKKRAVKVEASTAFLGEAESVEGAVLTRSSAGLESRNPRTTLVWSPTLQPGETKKLPFTYKVYLN